MDRTMEPKWAMGAGFAAIAFLALAFFVSGMASWYAVGWAVTVGALTAFCACIGIAVNGRPAGLIIDNRNRVSLSKFQATAWSILILSALITAALVRVRLGLPAPLDITLRGELLAVMGISATSLVASPVVLSMKAGETPPDGQIDATAAKLGDDPADVSAAGKLYTRDAAGDASWLDMFRGEEVSNAAAPDLGKVQQFLISVVVMVIYAAALWSMFDTLPPSGAHRTYLGELPPFGQNMAWLVGISHTAYLAYKAAPHGRSAESPAAQSASTPDGAVG